MPSPERSRPTLKGVNFLFSNADTTPMLPKEDLVAWVRAVSERGYGLLTFVPIDDTQTALSEVKPYLEHEGAVVGPLIRDQQQVPGLTVLSPIERIEE